MKIIIFMFCCITEKIIYLLVYIYKFFSRVANYQIVNSYLLGSYKGRCSIFLSTNSFGNLFSITLYILIMYTNKISNLYNNNRFLLQKFIYCSDLMSFNDSLILLSLLFLNNLLSTMLYLPIIRDRMLCSKNIAYKNVYNILWFKKRLQFKPNFFNIYLIFKITRSNSCVTVVS